jgi:hypothetical protein
MTGICVYKKATRVSRPVMFRLSWKAFPNDPECQAGAISDADKVRILAMPVVAVLAEVAAASISGKRAAARASSGSHFVGIRTNHGERWQARIQQGSDTRSLGTFSEAEAAARAYDAAAWRVYGRCVHVQKPPRRTRPETG